jgi:hypothetical protein
MLWWPADSSTLLQVAGTAEMEAHLSDTWDASTSRYLYSFIPHGRHELRQQRRRMTTYAPAMVAAADNPHAIAAEDCSGPCG